MCCKKRRLYRRAKKTQEPRHKEVFKTVQNETRKALKKAHWSYVNGILSDGLENGDTKPFYRYVKSQQQDNQGVCPLCDHGQLYSVALSKARILSEQFKSVFTRDDPQSADQKLPGSGHPTIPLLTIDTNGVVKLLHNLNPRKASGPDEVPAHLLQSLAAEVAQIFEQSIHPWKPECLLKQRTW